MSKRAKIAIESMQKAGKETQKTLNSMYEILASSIVPCKKCKKAPVFADVGGNIPYYEMSCSCGESPVVGSHNMEEAITIWNILNRRSGE